MGAGYLRFKQFFEILMVIHMDFSEFLIDFLIFKVIFKNDLSLRIHPNFRGRDGHMTYTAIPKNLP